MCVCVFTDMYIYIYNLANVLNLSSTLSTCTPVGVHMNYCWCAHVPLWSAHAYAGLWYARALAGVPIRGKKEGHRIRATLPSEFQGSAHLSQLFFRHDCGGECCQHFLCTLLQQMSSVTFVWHLELYYTEKTFLRQQMFFFIFRAWDSFNLKLKNWGTIHKSWFFWTFQASKESEKVIHDL